MKRTEQISAYVFRPAADNDKAPEYLALRRSESRGGFWQGVTGGLEPQDKDGIVEGVFGSGSREAAGAVREVGEELSLTPTRMYETGYSFGFTDPKDGELIEHVVGVQVEKGSQPTLSDEHDAAFWVGADDMRALVGHKWPENVIGFNKAHDVITEDFQQETNGTFSPKDWTLVIEKPDAIELGIEDEIKERLQERGLQIVMGKKAIELTDAMVDKIWLPPKDRDPWYHATVSYMKRLPVNVYLARGEDASKAVTDVKMELRKKYDKNYRDDDNAPVERRVESIIHGSDRMEELARQALLFFSYDDLNALVNDGKIAH